MKKLFILCLFAFSLLGFSASADEIKLEKVPFDVVINNQKMDYQDEEYPILFHNGIVYLPATYNMNSFIGLKVKFFPNYFERGGIFIGVDERTAPEYIPYARKTTKQDIKIQNERIVINKTSAVEEINNTSREHPIFNCKNVLYIPLTYDIAVEALDWKISFSKEGGLAVDTAMPNRPVMDEIQVENVFSRSPARGLHSFEYAFSEKAYAAYPGVTYSYFNKFRYKEVGSEELRMDIDLPDGDIYFNCETETGRDVKNLPMTAPILDENGILTIKAVEKYQTENGYIGENVTMIIDVKNGVLIDIIR